MTLILIILFSIVVSLVSFSGLLIILGMKKNQNSLIDSLVGFAAGVMLATAFFDLLPEAMEKKLAASQVFIWVFAGIVFSFFVERFSIWFHHHGECENCRRHKPTGLLVLIGDGFHNALDGMVIAAGFLTSFHSGLLIFLAVLVHEIPQEFGDFAVLSKNGFGKTKALIFNFISGLLAVVGAVVFYFGASSAIFLEPVILSFSAGMFIYLSSSDLIPELHEKFAQEKKWSQTIFFLLGIGALLLLKSIVVE